MSPLVTVLIGTSLLGCIAGVVGCFAVLRRRALVGDLVAHAALPGICFAFVLAGQRQFSLLMLGALFTGLLGVSFVTFISRWTRTKEDAAIGIVLSTFFGAGVAMSPIIQHSAGGSKAGLETYLYGQAASMVRQDLWMIAGVSTVALCLVCLLYKEFKLLSFDQGFARAQGWPTLLLDLAMMGLMALIVVVGLPAVGVVLMAAMLITPAAAARMWTNRLGLMLLLAGSFGIATGVFGTVLSDDRWREALPFDPLRFGSNNKALPTGPLIVLSGTAIFLFSLLFAPRRGVIARAVAHLRLRVRVAREHLLRTLYELSEPTLPAHSSLPIEEVAKAHEWTPLERWVVFSWARHQGLIETGRYKIKLTAPGLQEAAELTRRHRLWELFLIHGVNIAPDHVDRDADDIEHILPPDVVAQIEKNWLEQQAKTSPSTAVPDSPHTISSAASVGDRHE